MVVDYFDVGRQPPYVRGAFVAHDDVDDLLRRAEPKAHDRWQTEISADGKDTLVPAVSSAVLSRVRSSAAEFRRLIRPPARPTESVRLPLLDRLFAQVTKGDWNTSLRPDSSLRSVAIDLERQDLELVDDESIRLHAVVSCSLPHLDSALCEIAFRCAIVEDSRALASQPLEVDAPEGFAESDTGTRFLGVLTRSPSAFTVTTTPYASDWTAKLVVTANIASTSELL
jgi:hypothetical protein